MQTATVSSIMQLLMAVYILQPVATAARIMEPSYLQGVEMGLDSAPACPPVAPPRELSEVSLDCETWRSMSL